MKHYFLLVLFLLFAHSAWAATYYVAKTGSDSNSCATAQTISTPKQTIAAGAACLAGGDTLSIRAGTYAEDLNNSVPSGASWDAATTVTNYNSEVVWITSLGFNGCAEGSYPSAAYVIVNGILINPANTEDAGLYIGYGGCETPPNHIRYQNGEIKNANYFCGTLQGSFNEIVTSSIHDCHGSALSVPPHGIYLSHADDCLIDGNTLYGMDYVDTWGHPERGVSFGIHGYGPDTARQNNRNIIRNNTLYNDNLGILIGGGADNKVYNNVIRNTLLSTGIEVGYPGIGHTGTLIYNNTINGSAGFGMQLGEGWDSLSGILVKNNIISNSTSDPIHIYNGSGTVSYNDLYGNGNGNAIGGTLTGWTITGNPTGDPAFTNAAGGVFSILSTSAARNTGTDLSATLTTDIVGTSRPQESLFDIGAYEYINAPPTATIQSPTLASTYATSSASLSLSGIASDDEAVTSVTWTCDNCTVTSGTATGTTSWSQALTLTSGSNTIVVTAHDVASQTGTAQIVVTYTPGGTGSGSNLRMKR